MSSPLWQAKQAARADLRRVLAGLHADFPAISIAICRQLEAQTWWHQAHAIMLFAPMPGEVDLGSLAHAARAAGQRIAIPRVDWAARTMSPAQVVNWPHDLVTGRHGVPEPREGLPRVEPGTLDVIITPGLGFDVAGNRLGRGAGFYDRFLGNADVRARVVGVCPEAAIRDAIPAGATDVPVRQIVTERRVICCGGS